MLTLPEAKTALTEIGFWFLKQPPTTGTAFWVELACREFQRYARLPKVAMDPDPAAPSPYSERLMQVDNAAPLPTSIPVDGNYNEPETEQRIKEWAAKKWRIPVVITAWNTKANGAPLGIRAKGENLWLPNEVTVSKNVRMYATDLSEVYEPWNAATRYRLIGTYLKYPKFGGPAAIAGKHTFAHIGYLDLTGDTPGAPTTPEQERRQKTYRVIAGVANAEVELSFDAINSYDDSILSTGPYQWTIGQVSGGKVSSGEFGGFMSLLKYRKAANQDPSFDLLLGRWDLDVKDAWPTPQAPSALFNDDKTYKTCLTERRQVSGAQRIEITEGRRTQFFQCWHWFYRFQAASRFSSQYQWSMWHMSRVRLRDILATPWPEATTGQSTPMAKRSDGTTRPATIGEVYQSELALALILRWHVWAPGEVIFEREAGRGIRRAFNRACASPGKPGVDVSKTVDHWPADWENALIAGLEKQIPLPVFDKPRNRKEFVNSIGRVKAVVTELDPPSLQRTRTFAFDDTNMPPVPPDGLQA